MRTEHPNVQEARELPTVLVAAEEELLKTLVPALEAVGYVVFAARNTAEALRIVVTHSRSIHILLADVNMDGQELAKALAPYRPDMRVFMISENSKNGVDVLNPETAVAKLREVL